MTHRWPNHLKKPHFVTDSAFGVMENLQKIHEWGGKFTSSIPSGTLSWLWESLSYNVPPNSWRAAIKNQWIASSHTITVDDSFVRQQVITNAFKCEKIIFPSLVEKIMDNNVNTGFLLIYVSLTSHNRYPNIHKSDIRRYEM